MTRSPNTSVDGRIARILVATDFEVGSAIAVERAAELAKRSSARLSLAHVLGLRRRSGDPQLLLRREADAIRARYGVSVDLAVAEGIAHIELAALAQGLGADLVVTGLRGGWLRDLLGAPTALRVRRRISVPVLAVKNTRPRPYRQILWAVEPGDDTPCAARRLVALFPGAQIRILHACNPFWEGKLAFAGVDDRVRAALHEHAMAKAVAELNRLVSATSLRAAYQRVVLGSPVSAILERVALDTPDLTVLGPSAKSSLGRLLAGSVTQALLPHLPGDALLL